MTFVTRTYDVRFRFRVKDLYSEREIEDLLETLERRGANYAHLGEGWYEVEVAPVYSWMPFYRTMQDCDSIQEVHWLPFSEAPG